MKKGKKKIAIAILCVVLNIVLLSQLLFGSVSALYGAVVGLVTAEEDVCCEGHELEPEVVELEPMVAMSSEHTHTNGSAATITFPCGCTTTVTTCGGCGVIIELWFTYCPAH